MRFPKLNCDCRSPDGLAVHIELCTTHKALVDYYKEPLRDDIIELRAKLVLADALADVVERLVTGTEMYAALRAFRAVVPRKDGG